MSSARSLRMPFGSYRGTAIASLTNDYLRWLITHVTLRDPLRTAVHEEAARRGRDAAGQWLRDRTGKGATR